MSTNEIGRAKIWPFLSGLNLQRMNRPIRPVWVRFVIKCLHSYYLIWCLTRTQTSCERCVNNGIIIITKYHAMKTTSRLLSLLLLTARCNQLVTSFLPRLKTSSLSRTKQEPSQQLNGIAWRQVLDNALSGAAAIVGGQPSSKKVHAVSTAQSNLQADLPMVRLNLPKGGLGNDYVAVKVNIQGMGPFDFMVDSGLTTELITPHLQKSMGIGVGNKKMTGYGAGGSSIQSLVDLNGVSLPCPSFMH